MNIGQLDQRIKLQTVIENDTDGSLKQSWKTVRVVYAKVKSERGTEAFEAARVNAREIIRVQMHYHPDVTTKWRLEWMGQFYEIIAVDRSGHRQGELWVTAQLVGAL